MPFSSKTTAPISKARYGPILRKAGRYFGWPSSDDVGLRLPEHPLNGLG